MPAPICIFCEGPSEARYLNAWNVRLRDANIPLVFIPKPMNGGILSHVKHVVRKFQYTHRRTRAIVWADSDLYHRNDGGCATELQRIWSTLPPFEFSVHNFEDFIAAHLPNEDFEHWQVEFKDHLIEPLHSRDYNPRFQHILRGYSKGILPPADKVITFAALRRLKQRLPLLQPPNLPANIKRYPLFGERLITEIETAASLLLEDIKQP
ncbi:MAG: hypothetical protein Q4C03_05420 [bacterium]|nr:hypothetical protein [bacterium]MDO5462601.1 hypothetical protein [bacterium]